MKSLCGLVLSFFTVTIPEFTGKVRLLRAIGVPCKGALVESRYGVHLEADLVDNTNLWSLLGWFDEVADEVKRLEPGEAFVDIGANAGLFSLLAGKRVGPAGIVIAFEPQKRLFTKLVANVQANGLEHVYCFPVAISDATRPIGMENVSPRHTGIASLKDASDPTHLSTWAIAPGTDFRLLEAMIRGRRTTIKIDVEGHEERVLRGIEGLLSADHVQRLIVEIDQGNLDRHGSRVSDLYRKVQEHGFRPTRGLENGHYDEIFIKSE